MELRPQFTLHALHRSVISVDATGLTAKRLQQQDAQRTKRFESNWWEFQNKLFNHLHPCKAQCWIVEIASSLSGFLVNSIKSFHCTVNRTGFKIRILLDWITPDPFLYKNTNASIEFSCVEQKSSNINKQNNITSTRTFYLQNGHFPKRWKQQV